MANFQIYYPIVRAALGSRPTSVRKRWSGRLHTAWEHRVSSLASTCDKRHSPLAYELVQFRAAARTRVEPQSHTGQRDCGACRSRCVFRLGQSASGGGLQRDWFLYNRALRERSSPGDLDPARLFDHSRCAVHQHDRICLSPSHATALHISMERRSREGSWQKSNIYCLMDRGQRPASAARATHKHKRCESRVRRDQLLSQRHDFQLPVAATEVSALNFARSPSTDVLCVVAYP